MMGNLMGLKTLKAAKSCSYKHITQEPVKNMEYLISIEMRALLC